MVRVNSTHVGALLGLAVGDALGTTLEFQRLDAPAFPALATGPHVEVVGAGPFAVAPGQVTDDTQLACALFASLRERGKHDVVDVAERYVDWRRYAFDIGNQTARSIRRIAAGEEPLAAGRATWQESGQQAAGNGSLMRTIPIAVCLADDPEARRRASIDDSASTHFDPRCLLACAVYNAAVGAAFETDVAAVVLEAARAELEAAAAHACERWPELERTIMAARGALADDLAMAERDDPELYTSSLHIYDTQGFVRVAFRLAFWELCHAPDFRAGLIDVVNRGGDADTNGAIAGGLLGAFYGRDAIPEPWRRAVLEALPADDRDPLTTRYHPRQFVGEG